MSLYPPSKHIQTASVWVACDANGVAPCPQCGAPSWHRGEKWGACEHAVGPGSIDKHPAIIYANPNQAPGRKAK
jgi:hypothetical protein